MKKILTVLVICTLTLSSTFISFAKQESPELVPVQEYEIAMNDLYAEYDSKYAIVDTNGIEYISKEKVDQKLHDTKEWLEQKKHNELLQKNLAVLQSSSSTPEISTRRAMPYTYHRIKTGFKIEGSIPALLYANFACEVYATGDAQRSIFLSLESSDFYKSGGAINLDSWDLISKTASINNDKEGIYVSVKLDATFSYTDPILWIKAEETNRYEFKIPFSINE